MLLSTHYLWFHILLPLLPLFHSNPATLSSSWYFYSGWFLTQSLCNCISSPGMFFSPGDIHMLYSFIFFGSFLKRSIFQCGFSDHQTANFKNCFYKLLYFLFLVLFFSAQVPLLNILIFYLFIPLLASSYTRMQSL